MTETLTKPAPSSRRSVKVPPRRGGVSLGRWFGIEIGLEPSWFIIFALLTFSLSGMLAASHPDLAPALHWSVALLGSLFFFGSILTHELAHSLLAIRNGIRVHSITLHIFGGVSRLGSEAKRPRDEFLIAIVGPATSGILGALFLAASSLLPASSITTCVVRWLGYVNLGLGAFNLLPGFPLDGGRVLKAMVWAIKKDLRKADEVAHLGGQAVAYGLILIGVTLAFGLGQFSSGLWLGFLGWFLLSAAQSSRLQSNLRDILGRLHVKDVMREARPEVSPYMTLSALVDERVLRTGERTFFVSDEGRFLGLVTLQEIKGSPRHKWETLVLREVMVPLEQLTSLSPSDTLVRAFETLDEQAVNQLPVTDGERLVGMLSREDMLRLVNSHLELKPKDRP